MKYLFEIIFTLTVAAVVISLAYRNAKKECEMNDSPQIGDRRVSHYYSKNGVRDEKHYKADTVAKAIEIIEREAAKQVNDNAVDWNAFSYEVLGEKGWEEFEDEQYRDINEIMKDMES